MGGNRGWRNETPAGSKTEVSVSSEAEFKEKHGVSRDPMPNPNPESTTTHFTMAESALTVCQSRPYPPVSDLGFGLGSVQRKYPGYHLLNETQWVRYGKC